VRVICPKCKEEYTPDPGQLKELGLSEQEKFVFSRGKGCQYCMQTTYRGRIGIFEVMRVTDKIRELIIQKHPATKIKEAVIEEGMATLKDSAIEKVAKGLTTVQEIKRVIFASEE
jgi:type II secretory ATPase GspE/PulE/Tfp pilus assembly ATPase PilB-like protein